MVFSGIDLPEYFDWKDESYNCVGDYRNQGSCGSCWAFSAIDSFNTRRCIAGRDKNVVQYSEQYVTSCDQYDMGCIGGEIDTVWQFLTETGTTTDKCVPYTSGPGDTGTCPTKCKDGSALQMIKALGYVDACSSVESMMTALVQSGPVTVDFEVYADFMQYSRGIYQHVWGDKIGDHAVDVVGYGAPNGNDPAYWIVRNSWGGMWGDLGYFKMIKGTNDCGFEENCIAGIV